MRSVELDAQDRRVLGAGERQDTEFGLVLSDTVPRVLGAVKLSFRPGAGFHVTSLVDEQTCQAVKASLASEPGVPAPAALGTDPRLTFVLGGRAYSMLLNGHTDVEATLTRSG